MCAWVSEGVRETGRASKNPQICIMGTLGINDSNYEEVHPLKDNFLQEFSKWEAAPVNLKTRLGFKNPMIDA